jgi:hypothetical protein
MRIRIYSRRAEKTNNKKEVSGFEVLDVLF